MLNVSYNELKKIGAEITATEIAQQPELWEEAFTYYKENRRRINAFLDDISDKHNEVHVIFTGAGTSAYVGETILPYLQEKNKESNYSFSAIPTTNLVSNPMQYFNREIPTILVSCARSGNSPESLAAVVYAKELVTDLYQITVTCAKNGKLAVAAVEDKKNLLLLMPERSNDQGFAMTGSFTCMTLTNILIFTENQDDYVKEAIRLGTKIQAKMSEIENILDVVPKRIIYLGSGSLAALAREAQLKVLELTAGEIATMFESSLGFRHGPKSFVNSETIIISFLSQDPFTQKYDVDMLKELENDVVAKKIVAITAKEQVGFVSTKQFVLSDAPITIPDVFLALPYVMVAQFLAVIAAIKLGNKPDTPSPSGTVNRVVQGVTIYSLDI